MRYNELLIESAARELAEKLPTLSHHTYNSIDKLMQHISAKHKISGKKLHDLFVHKYGHTPDVWIKKLKHKLGEENTTGNKVFQSMSSQLLSIGKDADKIKKHDPTDIKNAIVKKLNDINDPKLSSVTKRFLQKVVEFNRSNPKTMAAIFGFTFAVIARTSMQVSHNLGLTPTQATLILEATLPTLGNFLGYLVNGFSVKDSIQSGLIAGAIGVGGTIAASGALNELKDTEKDIEEGWSEKYKRSIDCSHPKGFSQKAHCAGKKKHNESVEMEMVCPDCGMCETHSDHENLDEACWKGYHKEGNKKMFGKTYPNRVKNESEETVEESCPHCNGPMFSEMMMNEKKDACYYKVKSRYKVWPSAYASGALVKCRKKGASNWGNSTKNESIVEESVRELEENLHQWFKEKWVRFGPDGKIRGACARGDDSEGKPKCLPQSKAHILGKKGRASAAARKRREDPNPERHGKAINVNTKKKTSEQVNEISDEKLQGYLSRADRQVSNRLGNIGKARERLNKGYEIYKAEDPRHPIEHFTANTPEEARKYYHNYIDKYESDVDFDLRLRKSTGLPIGEGALPWDGKAVVVSDEKGNMLDTLDINTASQKYGLNSNDIRNQLKIQPYTTLKGSRGVFIVSHPMVPTALDRQPTLGLNEDVSRPEDIQKIKDFIKWAIKTLHIQKPYPKITLSRNTKVAQQGHHTGVHTEDNKIWVYIENRNLIDIFRTIFHELVHERQSQLNMIKDGDSYPGSPIEAMADLLAGKYIKIYGKQHPEIFQ